MNRQGPARAEREKNVMIDRNGQSLSDLARRHVRRRGVALIWSAIMLLVMILFVGLSLDTANVALVMHQLQNAADGASLAGANFVKKDRSLARLQAQLVARENIEAQQSLPEGTVPLLDLNLANAPNGDIVIGWYNRQEQTFTPSAETDAANAMAVITTRSLARGDLGGPVALIFGSIAGVNTVNLAGIWQTNRRPYAIAMCAGGTGAGLIALSPTGRGLDINGNPTLNVMPIPPAEPGDGEIQINSSSPDAFHVDGNPTVQASALNVTGGVDVGNYELTMPYNSPAPPLPDPLAWLEAPYQVGAGVQDSSGNDISGLYSQDLSAAVKTMVGDTDNAPRIDITSPPAGGGTWVLNPGYYPDGFYINSSGSAASPTVHFNPGVYIIGGNPGPSKPGGLIVTSQSYVTSNEATFFITSNAAGTTYGIVNIQAGAGFQASEPTSGYYEGVTIFQDRLNTNRATIYGSGNLDLNGTLYFPNADPVYLRGGGNGFGNQLIAWRFDIGGTGTIGIQYDGRNRAPVTMSFLVE